MAKGPRRSLADVVRDVEQRAPGLLSNAAELIGNPKSQTIDVTSVTQDSREVEPGSIFCAIRGHSVDGHNYIAHAVERGAVCVLRTAESGTAESSADELGVAVIVSSDTAKATGFLAAAFFSFPTDDVALVAVTGTNGKTSIVSLLSHVVNHCGGIAAAMGTLTGSLTTAAAPDFHLAVSERRNDGATVIAAEVSSHALDQQRIAGAQVAVAVFTNLTQDHLDYHADMDDYFEAKARLFAPEVGAAHVIDTSDAYGRRLADRVRETQHAESLNQGDAATARPLVTVAGDEIASAGMLSSGSSTFMWREFEIRLPLGGSFNVNNAVLAAEAAVLLGFEPIEVAKSLRVAPQVPGRFESVDHGQPFGVVVDYSHTPASIAVAIASARELSDGRVIIVFGAGGDRDVSKRPLMGEAASAADVLYVTSDNPRTEDPAKIVDEVIVGVSTECVVNRVVGRSEAIVEAISEARAGDIVIIAGKGHETYQIMGTTRTDFDDRVHARDALARAGWTLAIASGENAVRGGDQ